MVSGTAKGRRLKMVPGEGTRPITDRVKEALFNILGSDVIGARFIDLFAGTGGVGIEALSRGAEAATFVDMDRRAVDTIRSNLALTGFGSRAEVVRADALAYLRTGNPVPADFIYVAPPQYKELWSQTVAEIDRKREWLRPDGWVIAQMHPVEAKDLTLEHLEMVDERRYGSTLLRFYERPGQ